MATFDQMTKIETIGEPKINSPIDLHNTRGNAFEFVKDDERVLLDISAKKVQEILEEGGELPSFEKAGPREKIFFETKKSKAAIVTCGGLCPGINDVIRNITMGLYHFYDVTDIVGIPYGYEGLIPSFGHEFIKLTPDVVRNIHEFGGTILGSSRGAQDIGIMVDTLVNEKIDMLFTVGGDGTLRGAAQIAEEIKRRGLNIVVAGIPKTIDNDIDYIDKSFGFETAFDIASPIVRDAHNEATGAYNGIAIVKLMGRDSGFIAACAALSMPVVNFVITPEMNFQLTGEDGLLNILHKRLKDRKHAVIVVAEGAGQHLFQKDETITDASGNIMHQDIGTHLKSEIATYFKQIGEKVTIKYIDPSYIIRCAPANANDTIFCSRLAYNAVHGAMAVKTQFVIGILNNKFVYMPIDSVIYKRKR
ncbi:MAG: ATP-dependent 6-phosphofructokinase, partial [Leeuwenhoekiella sp.]